MGGHAALSRHIGQSLMADEFDMSFFRDKPLDHGFFSPMSALLPCDESWPVQIVPLQVGVLQLPIPTARRCYKLGQALRRAIESYPEDLKVAIVATGGCHTRCTASVAASTTRSGTRSSLTCW